MPRLAKSYPQGVSFNNYFPQGQVILITLNDELYKNFCEDFTAGTMQEILHKIEERRQQTSTLYYGSFAEAYNDVLTKAQHGIKCAVILNDTFNREKRIQIENINTLVELPKCSSHDQAIILEACQEKLALIESGYKSLLAKASKENRSIYPYLIEMQNIGAVESIGNKLSLMQSIAQEAVAACVKMSNYPKSPIFTSQNQEPQFNAKLNDFFDSIAINNDKALQDVVNAMYKQEINLSKNTGVVEIELPTIRRV
jgi:hypothetical protein